MSVCEFIDQHFDWHFGGIFAVVSAISIFVHTVSIHADLYFFSLLTFSVTASVFAVL